MTRHTRKHWTVAVACGVLLSTAPIGAEEVAEKGGLLDQTPLCTYLERGIDDFTLDLDGTARVDHYSVIPPGVGTLADIEHLRFGLDLPLTHCIDNPHSVPCADKDLTLDWCINSVGLSVLGFNLFDAQSGDCLLDVKSGFNGMETISGDTLRSHPDWGFAEDDLAELFSYFNLDDFTFQIPRLSISGDYLELLVESTVGDLLSRMAKGCSNDLYCGNKGGLLPLAYFSPEDDANCDFGDCDLNLRQSPPWLEIIGEDDHLLVDVDIQLTRTAKDFSDKQTDGLGNPFYGETPLKQYGHGSLQFDMAFPCREHHRLLVDEEDPDTPDDDIWRRLPLCTGADEMCVEIAGDPAEATISCPEGEDSTLCNLTVSTFEPSHELGVDLNNLFFDFEGGIAADLLPLFCSLTQTFGFLAESGPLANIEPAEIAELLQGCEPGDVVTNTLDKSLDNSAFSGITLIKDLPACPMVTTAANGDVEIDFIGDPEFEGGIKIVHPASPEANKSAAMPLADKPAVIDGLVAQATKDTCDPTVETCDPTGGGTGGGTTGGGSTTTSDPLPRVTASWIAEQAYSRETTTRSGKIPMRQLDGVIGQLCAASKACQEVCATSPDCEGSYVPGEDILEQLFTVNFNELEALLQDAGNCGDPACWQEKIDAINDLIGFLFYDPDFGSQCIAADYVPDPQVDDFAVVITYLFDILGWYDIFKQKEVQECSDLDIEGYFPTLALVLELGTAQHNVSDTFPFVNFQEHTYADSEDSLFSYRCEHVEHFAAEPSEAPVCGDDGRIVGGPNDGEWCGTTVGGPCRDIRDPSADLPGPNPEDPGYHPNGDYKWYTRCDEDDLGNALSCVEEYFPGSGTNYAGVCKRCGVANLMEDPDDFTMVGCDLAEVGLESCPDGLFLGADGKCWDSGSGAPEWECEADCATMYNDYGWCVHHAPWRSWMADQLPVFDQYEQTYNEPICAEHTSCPDSGVACAAAGKACQPDTEQCAIECTSNADCWSVSPAPAYPNHFYCDLVSNTCRAGS